MLTKIRILLYRQEDNLKRLDKSVLESTDWIDGRNMDYCLSFFLHFFVFKSF